MAKENDLKLINCYVFVNVMFCGKVRNCNFIVYFTCSIFMYQLVSHKLYILKMIATYMLHTSYDGNQIISLFIGTYICFRKLTHLDNWLNLNMHFYFNCQN